MLLFSNPSLLSSTLSRWIPGPPDRLPRAGGGGGALGRSCEQTAPPRPAPRTSVIRVAGSRHGSLGSLPTSSAREARGTGLQGARETWAPGHQGGREAWAVPSAQWAPTRASGHQERRASAHQERRESGHRGSREAWVSPDSFRAFLEQREAALVSLVSCL